MMNFIVLTVSLTIAMLMAGVIATVGLFALMSNGKFMAWAIKTYMKMIERSMKDFEKAFEDIGA